MLFPIAFLALFGCVALFMALKPETYSKYFLVEFQQRQLGRDPQKSLKAISILGWVMFGIALILLIGITSHAEIRGAMPYLDLLFFLGCGVAYIWWGIGLFRRPERFASRTAPPFDRLPLVAVKGFGVLLGIGAFGFFYGFVKRLLVFFR